MSEIQNRQLLHLVFGGESNSVNSTGFRDPAALHVAGVYPSYKAAYDVWKATAQKTPGNALMRYFIVHLHRLLDPSTDLNPSSASQIPGS